MRTKNKVQNRQIKSQKSSECTLNNSCSLVCFFKTKEMLRIILFQVIILKLIQSS